jgi:single stranded DNA-binding protein
MLNVLGRATTEVKVSEAKSGKDKYCRVPIAVNQKSKDKEGNEKETTYYYDLLLFNKSAENAAKLIQKGDLIFAFGKPDYDAFMSKKQKQAKYSVTIKPESWQLIK